VSERVKEQETAYLEALQQAVAYQMVPDGLQIADASGELTLVLVRSKQAERDTQTE
jgi:hypothetical protein